MMLLPQVQHRHLDAISRAQLLWFDTLHLPPSTTMLKEGIVAVFVQLLSKWKRSLLRMFLSSS